MPVSLHQAQLMDIAGLEITAFTRKLKQKLAAESAAVPGRKICRHTRTHLEHSVYWRDWTIDTNGD